MRAFHLPGSELAPDSNHDGLVLESYEQAHLKDVPEQLREESVRVARALAEEAQAKHQDAAIGLWNASVAAGAPLPSSVAEAFVLGYISAFVVPSEVRGGEVPGPSLVVDTAHPNCASLVPNPPVHDTTGAA